MAIGSPAVEVCGPRSPRVTMRPDVLEDACLPVAEVAVVEGIEAVGRERLERRRQRREPDPLAGSPRPPVRPVDGEEPGASGPSAGRHDRGRPLDRVDEPVPGREAGPCQLDGRGQDRVPRQPAPGAMRVAPRADGARDRDRERAATRQLGQTAGAEERGVGPRAGPPGAVERGLPARRRVPGQPERVAADPAGVGHDHREGGIRGDRRVDRGAAGAQDRRARPRSRGGAARRPRRANRARAAPAPRAARRSCVRAHASALALPVRPVVPALAGPGATSKRCSSRRSRASGIIAMREQAERREQHPVDAAPVGGDPADQAAA